MKAAAPSRVLRHTLAARLGHGAAAFSVALLLLTGYALAEALPRRVAGWLGGHAAVSGVHDAWGLGFAVVAMVLLATRWRASRRWLGRLCRVRRQDVIWLREFLRDFSGAREPGAWHAGRLDPLQRWVLALVLAMLSVVTSSGICLYLAPPEWRWVFVVAVRAHIYANEVLLAALAVHVLAGLGILPTHRGIWRSMFGDGAVPLATARRLWPGWTAGQRGSPRDEGEDGPRGRA
ncbi:MAG: cytochrome b/b6 domain-containing protein [Comamonas sp.]